MLSRSNRIALAALGVILLFSCLCSDSNRGFSRLVTAQNSTISYRSKVSCKGIPEFRATTLHTVHALTAASQCAAACRATKQCNAWFWCKEISGSCWERQVRRRVAARDCLLLRVPLLPGVQPRPKEKHPAFSSFAAGYFIDTEHRYLKYDVPPRLIIASAVKACAAGGAANATAAAASYANYLNWVSVSNKLDFARLHGFEFWLHAEKGQGDKVDAVQAALAEAPEGAWLLWADFDAVFANRGFTFPFHQYEEEGRQIVLGGNLNEVLAGNGYMADTGTLLLRNTEWTRALYGRIRSLLDSRATVAQMISGLKHYHEEYGGRNDRTALVWLVHRHPDDHQPQVRFETRYCMSCFWSGQPPETSFITHFLMTQKCNQFSFARNATYNPLLLRHYKLSRCTFMEGLASQDEPLSVLQKAHLAAAPGFEPFNRELPHPTPGVQILVLGSRNLRDSSGACRAACRAAVLCNAWLYCWHPQGCDNGRIGHGGRRRTPYRGCELMHLPEDQPFDLPARGPLYSSFSIGFFKPGQRYQHKKGSRQRRQQQQRRRLQQPYDFTQRHPQLRLGGSAAWQLQQRRRQQMLQYYAYPQRQGHGGELDIPPGKQPESSQDAWHSEHMASRRLQQQSAVQQKQEVKGGGNVALLTAVPPTPCKAPLADLLNALSLANKVDYARLHGYELHFSTSNIEANATGVFNKEAMITKMLAEAKARDVAWLWWVDIDTVIANLTRPLPLSSYTGRDFVAWGHSERLKEGNMQEGINNGVLLVRSSDWSRRFWGEVSEHATTEGLAAWRGKLEAELGPLQTGFFDTPIIVYLLKTRSEYYQRLFFERGPLGFNRHWMSVKWAQDEAPLVVHYAGCTTCSPPESKISELRVRQCNTEFARAFALSRCIEQRHFLRDGRSCSYNATHAGDLRTWTA